VLFLNDVRNLLVSDVLKAVPLIILNTEFEFILGFTPLKLHVLATFVLKFLAPLKVEFIEITADVCHKSNLPKLFLPHVAEWKHECNELFGMVGASFALIVPANLKNAPFDVPVIFAKGTPPNCKILSVELL
jgi:hypothetical protein